MLSPSRPCFVKAHKLPRSYTPPPPLIFPAQDGKGVQNVDQFLLGEAVKVDVEGIEFEAKVETATFRSYS